MRWGDATLFGHTLGLKRVRALLKVMKQKIWLPLDSVGKRAHLQTCVWKHALQSRPTSLDPIKYGYAKEEETKSLIPVTVLTNVQLAPDNILRLIRCTCASGSLCKSSRCQCNKAKLACTIFCCFRASVECYNDQTKAANDSHWKVTMFGHFGCIFRFIKLPCKRGTFSW